MVQPIAGARLERQRRFADYAGFATARLVPLRGDASFRRYSRLTDGTLADAILMDAPPPQEDLGRYLMVRDALARLGLRVPRVYKADVPDGLAIIEDFGMDTFAGVLAREPEREVELYQLAARALRHLHDQPDAAATALEPYDMSALLREVALFADWFVPAVRRKAVKATERAAFLAAWTEILNDVALRRETLVLRDYHLENLMLVPGETDVLRAGQLDFQDALIGAKAYDIISLMEDARRDVSAAAKAVVLKEYRRDMTDEAWAQLQHDMLVLGVQRHVKVMGIFVRLARRDGKPGYMQHIPRLQRMVTDAFAQPALAPVKEAMDTICPGWQDLVVC